MTRPAAIEGEYADFKIVRTRSCCQMVIELPLEHGDELIRLFGVPQPGKPVHVAVARLAGPTQIEAQAEPHANGDGREHGPWHTLTPTLQAVLRCKQEPFWMFLREQGQSQVRDEEAAATYVRLICGINTRSSLNTSNAAARKWGKLDGEYIAWLTVPQVVG